MSAIYDVHTHVGLDQGFWLRGWWPYASSAQDLLDRMDRAGIDRAVCFPFTLPSAFDARAFADEGRIELLPGRVPFDREIRLLIQEVERLDVDHRLRPFGMLDPSRCVDEQVGNLESVAGRLAGLKIQTTTLETPIRDLLGCGRVFMELAERHDLPVLLHTAVLAEDPWAQVTDCLAIAGAFPNVRFCLAHSLRFHAGYLREAAGMRNVWVDCAAHLAHCGLALEDAPLVAQRADRVDADYARPTEVLRAIHAILGDRYLWGSDNPYMSWCDDSLRLIHTYEEEAGVLGGLPAEVREDMASRGPRAFLGSGEGIE